MELFEWYGCYLLWSAHQSVMVVHLRGRHFDPVMDLVREKVRDQKTIEANALLPENNFVDLIQGDGNMVNMKSKKWRNGCESLDEQDGRASMFNETCSDDVADNET